MKKSNAYYMVHFALYFILTVVVVIAVATALFQFAPRLAWLLFGGAANIGVSVAVLVVAPMLLAGKFFRAEGRVFGRGEGWRFALFGALGVLAAVAIITLVRNLIAYGRPSGPVS